MSDDPKNKDVEPSKTLILKDWQERLAATRRCPPIQPMSEAEIAAPPRSDPPVGQTAQPLDSPETLPPAALPARDAGALPGRTGTVDPVPAPDHDRKSPDDLSALVLDRLEKLEGHVRRQRWFMGAILGLLGFLLASQVMVLIQNRPLEPRNLETKLRPSAPGPEGTSGLSLQHQGQQVQPAPEPQPDADPKLNVGDKSGLSSPLASQAQAIPPHRPSVAKVVYVGSKTSNKYHYPTCKWVNEIKPGRLIRFKSVEEARHRHYIPCPACKPPPLGPER
jgi:hypothetical protein